MAAEDKVLQQFLFKKVGPVFVIACCIYYFRAFFKHHTYDRIYAWVLNGFEWRVNKALKMEKQTIFDQLSKLRTRLNRNISVLEIGAGSAPNLHFFPEDTELVCLEPNIHFNQYIETNLKKSSTKVTEVTVIQGFAEKIPLEDEKFDAVVCTLVLCSVHDQTKSLSEIKRVLKPGGILLFVEHVGAEKGTFLRKVQELINPVWRIFTDGCEIVRDTGDLIKHTGFSSADVTRFKCYKMKMPLVYSCAHGVAVK